MVIGCAGARIACCAFGRGERAERFRGQTVHQLRRESQFCIERHIVLLWELRLWAILVSRAAPVASEKARRVEKRGYHVR